ncbi:MAG TPA: EamA family transporter [Gammaproteobacteria bacterium]|nr:EamA family transporter [Gammaproteobacteria bacterium]
MPPASRTRIALAFAVVYVVWGSTYLAIRIAVRDLPPALFAGMRFFIAGCLLGVFATLRGQRLPKNRYDCLAAAFMGLMMVTFGNGLVTWGEQWIASNQAALINSSSALWVAWFGTFGAHGYALSWRKRIGVAVGFGGVALMLLPGHGFTITHLWAQSGILLAAICWAGGAMFGRVARITTPALMFTALEMLFGGAALAAVGFGRGEVAQWHWTWTAGGALAYLIVFGSCFAYTSYIWLLKYVTPDKLTTISYVNPAIALLLGWMVLGESVAGARLIGMLIILAGIVLAAVEPRRKPVVTSEGGIE